MRRFSWLIPFILLTGSTLLASCIQWENDYAKAREMGIAQKKPLLLFFSGSDWSGWSMKMKKEVFEEPLFIDRTKESFIFVEIDFPANQVLSENLIHQNDELKKRFHVQEYPRLLVIDEKEREIARFSVEKAESLSTALVELIQNKKILDNAMSRLETDPFTSAELISLYKRACELKEVQVISALLDRGVKSEEPLFFLIEKYRLLAESGCGLSKQALLLRENITSLDPSNAKRAHLTLALIDFQTRDSTHGMSRKEVIHPLEEYLERFGEGDIENRWRLEMMVAQYYLNYDESKEALKHAEMATKTAPSDKREEIEQTVEYIRKQAHLASRK